MNETYEDEAACQKHGDAGDVDCDIGGFAMVRAVLQGVSLRGEDGGPMPDRSYVRR